MIHIALYLENGTWFAISDDPAVMRSFGTDTLPTAFTGRMPAEQVKREIQLLNPGALVMVQQPFESVT